MGRAVFQNRESLKRPGKRCWPELATSWLLGLHSIPPCPCGQRRDRTAAGCAGEGTDNNLAAVYLVLIWFCRCWAAPPHRKPNRPAFRPGKAGRVFMSVERDDQERPCLHCMMLELIDDFFSEYPAASGEPDAIDTDEVVTAIAKTVAELTCGQDGAIRQQLIEQLMREIIDYDAEFRRDAGTGAIGSDARH